MNLTKEFQEASRIAHGCAKILNKYYSPTVPFEQKLDGTFVTKADLLSNKYALTELHTAFPLDSIVSEEEQAMIKGSNERCWYIDPLDGTSGYIDNTDEFAVHIGLAERGLPILGIVYKPVGGKMFFGIHEQGAYMVSRGKTFNIKLANKAGRILACHPKLAISEIGRQFVSKSKVTDLEITGSEGLRIMRLATGRAHLYVGNVGMRSSSWDVCAPDAICRAAGATIRYVDGTEVTYTCQGKMDNKYIIAFDQQLLADSIKIIRSLETDKIKIPWV